MKNDPYTKIAENIDKNPLTAPKSGLGFSKAFIEYLELIFTPEEAKIIQYLKMPFNLLTVNQIAGISGFDIKYVKTVLAEVRRKGGLLNIKGKYCLPPIGLLINIHQVYPEIKTNDIKAAHLYQTFFIKEGFSKHCESSEKGTPVFRTIPVNHTIDPSQKILPAEEVHEFIYNLETDRLALVPCSCRTRTEKLGIRECKEKNPVGYCIMLGSSANYFQSISLAIQISKLEANQYVDDMLKLGLIAQTDNSIINNSIICLCCECCCSQIRGRTRWNNSDAILPSNFVPIANENCLFCGECADICPINAITVDRNTSSVVIDPTICIGCGVCAVGCPEGALWLHRYKRSTPAKSMGELLKTVARENKR